MAEHLESTKETLQNGNAKAIENFYRSAEVGDFFFGIRKKPGCLILKQNLRTFVSICQVIAERSKEITENIELYEAMKPIVEDIRFGYDTLLKSCDKDGDLWKTTFKLYKMTLVHLSPVLSYSFYNVFKKFPWKKLGSSERAEFYVLLRMKLESIVDSETAENAEQNELGKRWNFLLYDIFAKILNTCDAKSLDSNIQSEVVLIIERVTEAILEGIQNDIDTTSYQEMFSCVVPKLCYENPVLSLELLPICETIRSAGLSPDHPLSEAATQCTRLVMGQTGSITEDTNLKTHINYFLKNYNKDPLSPTPELMLKLYQRETKIGLIHEGVVQLAPLAVKMPLQHSIKICQLTQAVATNHPEIISEDVLKHVYSWLDNPQLARFGLNTICILYNHPSLRVDVGRLREFASTYTVYMPAVCDMLVAAAMKEPKDWVRDTLNWLKRECMKPESISHKKTALAAFRDIGRQHIELLKEFKSQLSEIKADGTLTSITEDIENLLNGISLSDVASRLNEAIIDIGRIERKTVVTPPKWSQNVAKLMNPQAAADWKLMAKRLSFTNDDLKAWVAHEDPCMSMLTEWFATHRSSEATRAVYIVLKEIGREDAAGIVANAISMAGLMVPVDEPLDLKNPPAVFISYQWEVQEKAKSLKDYLTDAGYNCWLDIGQMGGGNKLYEKIDNGIRAAKVVVSLVTEKYAESFHCNKEVGLSVTLTQKPMMPLLMEHMDWPPSGSMGAIFSDYLFIRFFQREKEQNDSSNYWPEAKMEELLMQLRHFIEPDVKLVSKKMDDWWLVKTGHRITGAAVTKSPDAWVGPDVFISYQWGKQPEVIELFNELTKCGFSCWLDIKQMGGGDSLYDKIDQGIRACKVVISCVTDKYAKSLNCRREVSLAGNLKKPIVPLLIEKCDWPPKGPMSMDLTGLLYIDFSSQESLTNGSSFENLLTSLKKRISEAKNSG